MRLRLVDLPVIGLAMISVVPAARAGELDQVRLRGSNAYAADAAPSYPIITSEPSYPGRAAPASYPVSYPVSYPASYPAASRPARPVALARPAAQLHNFTIELGARYWFSTGKLAKDLFDDPRSSAGLNSRLTYSGLTTGTFEGFGRANTTFGSYFKGYAGFSGLGHGTLNDEDFPPGISPYSNTSSQQQGGKLAYGSIDFGQVVVKNERFSASLFVGYGYLNESVNAYGCTQIAGNPFVCAPAAIGSGVLAITEESRWQFARLGILGEFKLFDCLKLSAEVAWLPWEQVTAQDTHWLRLGTGLFDIAGPIPESGGGTGVQIEAIMSYQLTDKITLGLGGRYWYLQTRGTTDFENVIVGLPFPPVAQPLTFTTTRYGGFAQGAYKFGPL
jgi:hypothetical protein